jgi:hypothetical protein
MSLKPRARRANAEARPFYVARAGRVCLETGLRLQGFVEQLCGAWEGGGGDVAVWMHGAGPRRLVAVLRESPAGTPFVTWL